MKRLSTVLCTVALSLGMTNLVLEAHDPPREFRLFHFSCLLPRPDRSDTPCLLGAAPLAGAGDTASAAPVMLGD